MFHATLALTQTVAKDLNYRKENTNRDIDHLVIFCLICTGVSGAKV